MGEDTCEQDRLEKLAEMQEAEPQRLAGAVPGSFGCHEALDRTSILMEMDGGVEMSVDTSTALVCDTCGHFFDPADERAYAGGPRCPCCTMISLEGAEAWAVWNSCQGIFIETIRDSRVLAEAMMRGEDFGTVVPILCYRRSGSEVAQRHWSDIEADEIERGTYRP